MASSIRYSKFQDLIKSGETRIVDYKEMCNAFHPGGLLPSEEVEAAKAELAKDICAMANNGRGPSYIIIGVSDDGRRFSSVINPGLKDDNLQDFCKKAIFPPPQVKLHRASWSPALPEHTGKEFVIIQIGPHTRQAFRLAQNFIVWNKKICYRKNEVWVRREATSDLATPEEIARLVAGLPIYGARKQHTQIDRPNIVAGFQDAEQDSQHLILKFNQPNDAPNYDELIDTKRKELLRSEIRADNLRIQIVGRTIDDTTLEDYLGKYREYLCERYEFDNFRDRLVPIYPILENRGRTPASDVMIEFVLPLDLPVVPEKDRRRLWLVFEDYEPSPPKEPKFGFSGALSSLGNIGSLAVPLPRLAEPIDFPRYEQQKTGMHISYVLPRLLQNRPAHILKPFLLWLGNIGQSKKYAIPVVINTAELPIPQTSTLFLDIRIADIES